MKKNKERLEKLKVDCSKCSGLCCTVQNLIIENEALCNSTPQIIIDIDIESFRNKVNIILKQVCDSIIKCFKNSDNNRLIEFLGRNFKKRDMSGLDLSMKLLIAANFDSCIFNGTVF